MVKTSLMTLAVLLSAATGLRAEMIPWTYTTSIASDFDGSNTVLSTLNDGSAGRFYVLFDQNLYQPTHGLGSGPSIASLFAPTYLDDRGTPDGFRHAGYTIRLNFTDDASGQSGVFTFRGAFDGGYIPDRWIPDGGLEHTFTSPTTQSLVLGRNVYTVTISYNPPVVLNEGGTIGAFIDVHTAPEPSTLGLAGLGLFSLGATAWRRRRKGTAVP
jgi:hypothetical protein